MNEYIIITKTPGEYTDDRYTAVNVVETLADGSSVVAVTNKTNPLRGQDTMVCGTDPFTGFKVELTNEAAYDRIRPLGNDAGEATGYLGYHKWAGEVDRQLGDQASSDPVMRLYPADVAPFAVEIRHKYYDTPATPVSTGWGFRSEIVGGYEARNPSARSMGAYNDPEYTEALWPAIGAYQLGPSDWQTDAEGNQLTVWYLDSWDGYRLPEKRTWYVVMLLGSAWEGKATLPVDSDGVQYLFWEKDQAGGPSVPQPWVQPAGAHDAYSIGDRVTHNGSTWDSTHNDNVWEPGVFGWTVEVQARGRWRRPR